MEFKVKSWLASDDKHGGPQVQFVKPRQLSCWSKHSIQQGGGYDYGSTAGLHPFSEPRLPADLNAGYPQAYIRKPEAESTPVEVIMRAAQQVGAQTLGEPNALLSTAQVVTFRNNLNKILGTPLSPQDGWVVDGCCMGEAGTLYLDIVKAEEKDFPDSDRFMYYGYKFEALCTSSQDGGPVDATSEYAALLGLKLGGLRLLMAAEIDCSSAPGAGEDPLQYYLELKTYKLPEHQGQERTLLQAKYPKWWLQSFLAGVRTLVLGGRDAQGALHEVRHVDVQSLPSTSNAQLPPRSQWSAWQMLRFGHDTLSWMREVAQKHAGAAVRFTYTPSSGVIQATLTGGELPGRLTSCLGA